MSKKKECSKKKITIVIKCEHGYEHVQKCTDTYCKEGCKRLAECIRLRWRHPKCNDQWCSTVIKQLTPLDIMIIRSGQPYEIVCVPNDKDKNVY